MEQHRTPPERYGPRRGSPPTAFPPQARRRQADERRPGSGAPRAGRPAQGRPAQAARSAARPEPAGRPLPHPRLTGLGGGLFGAAAMFLLGFLDQLLFGASLTLYGVLFLPVCVLTALWVRGGDLMTAPVVAPIAFAVGLVPVAESSGGMGGRVMGLVTALATQAGWLYGGTLVAGVIVLVRRARLVRRRALRRRTG
ncbi:DUF6542 domain-containing protein [Streptomyces sp. NPDC001544]|uniref:DUF6542 domain-containing protein n=1 Tax=Streptomyces sp. NPDC001544 TaxID=3364584 RepID=UPI0036C27A18